ncbi:MAG: c-type cytochrome [Candidatus Hydrogenedentes bacterium]|nr:c-type cytochrome [Candidatus Hydrogenedentota bacterium]
MTPRKTLPILLLVLMTGMAPARAQEGAPLSGERVFQLFCAVCHGPAGKGSPFGKNLLTPVARSMSGADMEKIILEGRPEKGMMSFSTLGKEELKGVVAHVRILQGMGALEGTGAEDAPATDTATTGTAATDAAHTTEGQRLFEGAAGCATCHSVFLRGGTIGPSMDQLALRMRAEELREALTEPSKTITEGYGTKTAILPGGRRVQARYRNETPETLQLLNETGDLWTTYFKKDLQELVESPNSLMPADAFTRLTGPERTALMKFLATLD